MYCAAALRGLTLEHKGKNVQITYWFICRQLRSHKQTFPLCTIPSRDWGSLAFFEQKRVCRWGLPQHAWTINFHQWFIAEEEMAKMLKNIRMKNESNLGRGMEPHESTYSYLIWDVEISGLSTKWLVTFENYLEANI